MDRALLRGPSYGDELKAWSVRLALLGPTPRLGTVSRIYATMLFVRTATNRKGHHDQRQHPEAEAEAEAGRESQGISAPARRFDAGSIPALSGR